MTGGADDVVRVLTKRVRKLERAIEGQALEVRTRRLVVIDRDGAERIVGEVGGHGTAELRMDLPGCLPRRRSSVVMFANPGDLVYDLPPGVGVQLWLDGDAARRFDVWASPYQ
jgi:hypothetical protein